MLNSMLIVEGIWNMRAGVVQVTLCIISDALQNSRRFARLVRTDYTALQNGKLNNLRILVEVFIFRVIYIFLCGAEIFDDD